MKLIYRGGISFKAQRTPPKPEIEATPMQPNPYQGLRYSRYGIRYIR